MEKKFDHAVIYNGVFYPANTPIKYEEPKAPKTSDEEKTAKGGVRNGK